MTSITEIIKPIKLLKGSHSDTGTTGQGCAMNVIAYLNGEPQITDRSPCVCVTVRPIIIFANDFLPDEKRQKLIPFLIRAMGSATDDRAVILERLSHVTVFADKMSAIAAKYAAKYAAECAKSAAEYAAECAKYAMYAAKYAAKSAKCSAEIETVAFEFLDAALPKEQHFPDSVLKRAQELAELA
jgi:hypothetical protein